MDRIILKIQKAMARQIIFFKYMVKKGCFTREDVISHLTHEYLKISCPDFFINYNGELEKYADDLYKYFEDLYDSIEVGEI